MTVTQTALAKDKQTFLAKILELETVLQQNRVKCGARDQRQNSTLSKPFLYQVENSRLVQNISDLQETLADTRLSLTVDSSRAIAKKDVGLCRANAISKSEN
jgi:hypothetical protein